VPFFSSDHAGMPRLYGSGILVTATQQQSKFYGFSLSSHMQDPVIVYLHFDVVLLTHFVYVFLLYQAAGTSTQASRLYSRLHLGIAIVCLMLLMFG
jgi:hypothetical protein